VKHLRNLDIRIVWTIAAVIVVAIISFAPDAEGNVKTHIITATPDPNATLPVQVVPIYITPEQIIPNLSDLWGCLQSGGNPASEGQVSFDRENYTLIDIQAQGNEVVYTVFNAAKGSTGDVRVEYGFSGETNGERVIVDCTIPDEWAGGWLVPTGVPES
jgi:hypothetical protein